MIARTPITAVTAVTALAWLAVAGAVAGCRWNWDSLAPIATDGGGDGHPADGGGAVLDPCLIGAEIPSGTSACVDSVCALDADCCRVAWSDDCRLLTERACQRSCSGMALVGSTAGLTGEHAGAAGSYGVSLALPGLQAFAAADFDRDGDLDVAYLDHRSFGVLRNDGGLATTTSVGGADLSASPALADAFDGVDVAWADWDNDGDLDVAFAGSGGVWLVRNDAGTFVKANHLDSYIVKGIAWADVDHDGDLDLVYGRYTTGVGVVVQRNDGHGSFTLVPQAATVLAYEGVALCDVTGSALPDLVGGDSAASTPVGRVYANSGGTFAATATWALDGGILLKPRCVDLDRDGDLDLVFGYWSDPYKVLVARNGGGSFDAGSTFPSANLGQIGSLAVGDVDGDGRPDVVAGLTYAAPAYLHNLTANATAALAFDDPVSLDDPSGDNLAVQLVPAP